MPKALPLDAALQYLRAKVPQLGMFSTLDELVRAAPFEKAPADQWKNYLQPGLTLQREGVSFPLKKEELDYTKLGDLSGGSLDRNAVLDYVHQNRPDIRRTLNTSDDGNGYLPVFPDENRLTVGDPHYSEYSHSGGVPNSYEENVTTSPDFGSFPSHFSPQDISWSRTTRHPVDDQQGAIARLIEEIQSDRHEAAAERTGKPIPQTLDQAAENFLLNRDAPTERRGYRTPEESQLLERYGPQVQGVDTRKPPDTPWKDPADYAGLELRKQLLNSVNQGDQYLALTRGADQVARYEQGMGGGKGEGMSYIYDTIYPKALRKLAKQYGADVTDVPISVTSRADIRPPSMREAEADTVYDYFQGVPDDPESFHRAAGNLLGDFEGLTAPGTSRLYSGTASDINRYGTALERGNEVDSGLQGDIEDQLHHLHQEWIKTQAPTVTTQKTFPAMRITPEVAERVKKAGVPLFSAAAASLLGSQSDDANANPVEDEAMKNVNGYDDGGLVLHPKQSLADAITRQATAPSAGADPVAQQRYLDQARVCVGDSVAPYMRLRAIVDAQKPAVNPTATAAPGIPDLVRMARERLTATNAPPTAQAAPGMSAGGSTSEDVLEANLENMILQQQLAPKHVSGYAEGGSTDDTKSSLENLSNWLKTHLGSDAQRVGTGIAKQLYGLDRNGNIALGGRAWTKDQGGTPAALLDELASMPATAVNLLNTLHAINGRGPADTDDRDLTPLKFSTDAADRLAQLDRAVSSKTGISEAQTLPEHLEDAAAMLARPIPAAGELREAPMLRRAVEFLTPVRPTTAGRYAGDTAMLGGSAAALQALNDRLNRKPYVSPSSQLDTTVEDAATSGE
jgi:hypothetical protein